MVKNPPASTGDAGDVGLIPGSERSPGGGNGNPLQLWSMGRKELDTAAMGCSGSKWDFSSLPETEARLRQQEH